MQKRSDRIAFLSLMGEVMDDLKLRLKEYANSRVA